MLTKADLRLIDEKTRELEERKKLIEENLPHKYGHKWYAWQRAFFNSTNKVNLLTAANQIGKSTVQIWKCIEWATNPALWPDLWDTRPVQFWYLYPDADTAFAEWSTKWLPFWMPKEPLKDHPQFGWEVDKTKREINSITFNTGVTVYFKTYGQNVHNLQAGTVHAEFCDEELPVELYDELIFRMEDTQGYFHSVFTPTRNQLFWYLAMECIGKPTEKLVGAFKTNVSAYDCLKFDDGTPGRRTVPQIEAAKKKCRNENEIKRRIFGRFVSEEGRLVPSFDPVESLIPPREIPADWSIFSGVDIGSGGGTGHPASITFIAVSPNCDEGEVFRGWRGDDELTTAGDVFAKYLTERGELQVEVQAYDSQAKDFETIADRSGETFQKAEKAQDYGYGLLDTLFKTRILRVHDTPELNKLAQECMTAMEKTPKSNRKDDFIDATRFAAVTAIPWDWAAIQKLIDAPEPPKPLTPLQQEIKERRGDLDPKPESNWQEIEDEISYWNGEYGS